MSDVSRKWKEADSKTRINSLIGALRIISEKYHSAKTEIKRLKTELSIARHERDIAFGLLSSDNTLGMVEWNERRLLLLEGKHEAPIFKVQK